MDASKGECNFNDEVLTVSTSMFVNPRTGEYESKPMLITVKEIIFSDENASLRGKQNRFDGFLPLAREGNHEDGTVENRERREDGATDARAIFGASDTGGGRGGVFEGFERRVDREFSDFDEEDVAEGRKKKRQQQDNAELESVLEEEEFEESFVPSVSEDLSPPQRGSDPTAFGSPAQRRVLHGEEEVEESERFVR